MILTFCLFFCIMKKMEIRIQNLTKEYDLKTMGLTDVSLEAEDGGFLTLVGAPGSGKSTLLFCIGGLLNATSGKIYFGDRDMTDADVKLRNVCLMREGQTPSKGTVYDNISFGLRLRRMDKRTVDERTRQAAEVLGLTDKLNKKIKTLSEIDRRRTSVARALARKTDVFLLDEPLFALGDEDREVLAKDIVKAHEASGITFIAASSQGEDAFVFGGKAAIMRDGRIVQAGTKEEILSAPLNMFVASFAGDVPMNFVRNATEFVGFRPTDAVVSERGEFNGTVENVIENGLHVRLNEDAPPVTVMTDYKAQKGDFVGVTPKHKITFDDNGNALTKYE